jgi:hypothetical protein
MLMSRRSAQGSRLHDRNTFPAAGSLIRAEEPKLLRTSPATQLEDSIGDSVRRWELDCCFKSRIPETGKLMVQLFIFPNR